MKKAAFVLAVMILVVSISSVTIFAFNGRGAGNENIRQQITQSQERGQRAVRYARLEVRAAENRNAQWPRQRGEHCRQDFLCDELAPCPVEGCEIRGVHEHDGVLYRCAWFGDGADRFARRGANGPRPRDGFCRRR